MTLRDTESLAADAVSMTARPAGSVANPRRTTLGARLTSTADEFGVESAPDAEPQVA